MDSYRWGRRLVEKIAAARENAGTRSEILVYGDGNGGDGDGVRPSHAAGLPRKVEPQPYPSYEHRQANVLRNTQPRAENGRFVGADDLLQEPADG